MGKEAPCNHKTSTFSCSLKWKMLVILPLQRSGEFGGPAGLLRSRLPGESWPPAPPGRRQGRCHTGRRASPAAVPGAARRARPLLETQPLPSLRRQAEGTEGGKRQRQQSPFPLSKSMNEDGIVSIYLLRR